MAAEVPSAGRAPAQVRKLERGDFDKGFLQVLAMLTTVGDVSKADFDARFNELDSSPDYYVAVAEDPSSGRVLGTAALIIERKFIHSCGKVGHIEDVVVDEAARGGRIGQRLIAHLLDHAKASGCYKVILDCAEHNIGYYEKCGLTRKEVQMVRYFDR